MCNLPGNVKKLSPASTLSCDNDSNLAVVRIQGETDSFGAEYEYLCDLCYEQYKEEIAEQGPMVGHCDHCGKEHRLIHWRDPGEGLCGPVYTICEGCASKAHALEVSDYEEYYINE